MTSVRMLDIDDAQQVLDINSISTPAVATLDRRELVRLMGLSGLHLVAEDGPVVLGYALAFRSDHDYDGEEFLAFRSGMSAPFVYVDQIAVRQEARRRGIGLCLYEALERSGAGIGAGALCCEVNTRPPNPDSLAFHKRLGFVTHGSLSTQDGRDVALLVKRIADGFRI